MTNILILEDTVDCLNMITRMVENVSDNVHAVPVRSLEEAREALSKPNVSFQAFLLDINLDVNNSEDMSGITFAREIRNMQEYVFTPIVMITSIANMELTAYRELHCYQFLVKPYNEKDIENLISKLLFISRTGETRGDFITVKKEGINYKLFCKDIVCIKAIPRGVNIVMVKEEIKVLYTSIKQLMEKLPNEQFVQIHRMYVVNQNYIESVDMVNGYLKLKTGMETEIGVTYRNQVRGILNG
ncbi:MAG: response regulator transcription factor [Lachnospiraceae bacterium]|nr:response regulator transcription factor [Lachnospiraceae bacterium]